jgi:hypothetical protein
MVWPFFTFVSLITAIDGTCKGLMATCDYGLTLSTIANLKKTIDCTCRGLMVTCDYGLTFSTFVDFI